MFGLSDEDIIKIKTAIKELPEIESVIVFGSRAMGNYKKGSDVDLAILGKTVTKKTVHKINQLLNEECMLQYFFDIVDYECIKNDELKEHIDRYGKKFCL
ncbi:MAG: DNA polymerase III subunit beta [Clostridiales bacterium GWE2_32_10]|nr:MAG: DNA polymerase III subunit beta [Clostridiales bacterium GWE2_32_10]HBY20300.1 DNA polymerase III subunit beta [Clostridiales bacterium]